MRTEVITYSFPAASAAQLWINNNTTNIIFGIDYNIISVAFILIATAIIITLNINIFVYYYNFYYF